ncbi:T9SS type A sorting domain-containing protein [Taibaiella soli]|uniref:Ig-like domain-containing protein n=1 Tax=Taibaiella soli TaxID=1649169 RepID=A0A2W2AHS0_9BACT|nr:T9SS type A sorting domain-containing protein [Taibaiella soli]PZF71770.1 hypothetical protein DN068_17040 [Taibaiella soli]
MKKIFLLLLSLAAVIGKTNGQCPATIQLNVRSNTPANCPSSGSVIIGSNASVGSLQYTITAGPAGAPLNTPQGDSTFSALPAGSYTVKANCASNPSKSNTINFTITDGYTPMTNIATTITSHCGSGGAGGTVVANSVTGGSKPLQYSLVQNNDPNYPDNLSVYGATTTFNPTAYGVYQLRVKDACGQLYTKTVQIAQNLPPVAIGINMYNDNPCNSTTWDAWFWLEDPTSGMSIDATPYFNAGGVTIKIYQATGTGSACAKGTLLGTLTNVTNQAIQLPKSSNGLYYYEVTTPCGVTTSLCQDATGQTAETVTLATNTTGCGTTSPAATMNIFSTDMNFIHYPLTVTVTPKPSGTPTTYTINDGDISITGLALKNYSVVIKDACGQTVLSQTINNPVNAGVPSTWFVIPGEGDLDCLNGRLTSQEGTVRVGIGIQGFLADLADAVATITAGPSNVGVSATQQPAGSGVFFWQNMLPGSYTVSVVTACGTTNFNFTVALPSWNETLAQHIQVVATSFCGGSGTVQIDPNNTEYNGYGTVAYVLKNAATHAGIDSNATGVFTNLSAGNYYIDMSIDDYCDDPNPTYNVSSNTVTINSAGTPASVAKKLGVICEDGSGNLLNTGSAYLQLAGAPPMILEYKLSTSSTWNTYSTNAPSSVTIGNLVPYAVYDVRVTSCGISSVTQVSIGKLDLVKVSNTQNPCINVPYTLAVPEMPGATYSWSNPANVIVSSSYNYSIPNYNASYDGIYTCTVSFGGCVTRTMHVTLNSQLCAQPLPIRLTSFTAVNHNCEPELVWSAIYHNTDKSFIVQRSSDGHNYADVAEISAKQGSGDYTYMDGAADLNAGNLYYRLKMVDLDNTVTYSSTEVIKGCHNNLYSENSFYIVPNPVTGGQNVTLTYNGAAVNASVNIVSASGQLVQHNEKISLGGQAGNTINISLHDLTAGIYIVTLTTDDGNVVGHEKLIVY